MEIKAKCNKGFSDSSSILTRTTFGAGRKESNPQSIPAYSTIR